jgi:hypothetical protein
VETLTNELIKSKKDIEILFKEIKEKKFWLKKKKKKKLKIL